MRKVFTTTFAPEFIELLKVEAIKRSVHVNELIELAVKEYLATEKGE